MNIFDFLYINTYKNNNKNLNIILSTIGIVSLFYSNLFGVVINFISILIDYRIFKNVFYNVGLFIIFLIINYIVYEYFKRREKKENNIKILKKYFIIDILYFFAFIMLFVSVYYCNEHFGIAK
jgi:hypothetical protein